VAVVRGDLLARHLQLPVPAVVTVIPVSSSGSSARTTDYEQDRKKRLGADAGPPHRIEYRLRGTRSPTGLRRFVREVKSADR
jgi:hypothetical protein